VATGRCEIASLRAFIVLFGGSAENDKTGRKRTNDRAMLRIATSLFLDGAMRGVILLLLFGIREVPMRLTPMVSLVMCRVNGSPEKKQFGTVVPKLHPANSLFRPTAAFTRSGLPEYLF
jgi:hypothetical protein